MSLSEDLQKNRQLEGKQDEESRIKTKKTLRELLWESYLKLKMIEDNNELLKLLQVC